MSTVAWIQNRVQIVIRSRDHEPAHVHAIVKAEGIEFRVFLHDLSVDYVTQDQLSASDEKTIVKFVETNLTMLKEKWDEIQKDQ